MITMEALGLDDVDLRHPNPIQERDVISLTDDEELMRSMGDIALTSRIMGKVTGWDAVHMDVVHKSDQTYVLKSLISIKVDVTDRNGEKSSIWRDLDELTLPFTERTITRIYEQAIENAEGTNNTRPFSYASEKVALRGIRIICNDCSAED